MYDYDFFVCASEADHAAALDLSCRVRAAGLRVFCEADSLNPGDEQDVVVPAAQRASRISVVVLSGREGDAFFRREAMARAIDLGRREGQEHRVVPVYLAGSVRPQNTDYGLLRLTPLFGRGRAGASKSRSPRRLPEPALSGARPLH